MCRIRTIAILLVSVGAAPLVRAARPDYAYPDQVAALEALISTSVSPEAGAAPDPDDLVQLSRLLADPCDQLRWLLAQTQALGAQSERKPVARKLAQAAARRGQKLADLGLLEDCRSIVPDLRDAAARLESLGDLTDPDELRKRLEQAQGLPDLDRYARFKLLARGVPAAKLLSGNTREDWDAPRRVLDRLAGAADLPAFAELRDLRQGLLAAYDKYAAQQPPAFPDASQQQNVTASFRIAAALADRALGLDADDQPASGSPIPYPKSPEEWTALAASLEPDALRTWATLARLLAASPPAGQTAQSAAVAAARAAWSDVRKLQPELWPAVDDPKNGWLARLGSTERLLEPDKLPLASGFGAARATARRRAEDELRALLRSGDPTDAGLADRVLQAIERAKATDLGLDTDFQPVNLTALMTMLGAKSDNWVYLFVELCDLHGTAPGAPASFCGVAVYRREYARYTPGREYTDQCVAKVIRSAESPEDLVRAALAAPGPPLAGNARIRKDARIIIAPDGALPPSWFAFERQTLLQPTEWTAGDPAWVVYTPPASAISSGRWPLDGTLRAWYRAAVRAGRPAAALGADTLPLALRQSPGPPLQSRLLGTLTVFRVALDATPPRPDREELFDFLAAKRAAAIPAIPLCVAGGTSEAAP